MIREQERLGKNLIQALLAPHTVLSTDTFSIKSQINSILEHSTALDNLNLTTCQWSPVLVHLFEEHLDLWTIQLDYKLRARWELILGRDTNRRWLNSLIFCVVTCGGNKNTNGTLLYGQSRCSWLIKSPSPSKGSRPTASSNLLMAVSKYTSYPTTSCPLSKQGYSSRKWAIFENQSTSEWSQMAKKLHLCIDCLGSEQTSVACPSWCTCQSCKKQHLTLLHFPDDTTTSDTVLSAETDVHCYQKISVDLTFNITRLCPISRKPETYIASTIGSWIPGQFHHEAVCRSPLSYPDNHKIQLVLRHIG